MLRKSVAMCMAMPMMPMMMMARMMSRSAESCGSRWMRADARGERSGRSKSWGCSDAQDDSAPRHRSVVETAREAGSFSSLLGALKAAGLDAALEGEGPFTVFAPDDEAFARVPAESLQGLLSDTAQLKKVLQFHVVNGRLSSGDLASVASLRTLDGRTLSVDVGQGEVGGARVVKADVACSNGVIHVVDSVLLPS